jgi:hypothetical protein
MRSLKKMVALLTIAATFGFGLNKAEAAEYSVDCGGCGYSEARKCPCLAPAIALGAIALAAIIAVAVQNGGHGHSHTHN